MGIAVNLTYTDDNVIAMRQGLSWVIIVISGMAMLSNLLVLLLFPLHRPLRTCANALVASLACADFFFAGAICVNYAIPRSELPKVSASPICVIIFTLVPWSSLASPWSLLAITVDRFLYIQMPLDYKRLVGRKAVCWVIAGIWLGSLSFTLLALVPWPRGHRTKNLCGDVITRTLPYMFTYFGLVAIPCLIIGFLYCAILRVAQKNQKQHQELVLLVPARKTHTDDINNTVTTCRNDTEHCGGESREEGPVCQSYRSSPASTLGRSVTADDGLQSPRKTKRIAKTTKMFFYLTVIFFVLWLPIDITVSIILLCEQCIGNKAVLYSFWVSVMLYTCTPMINPWVYTLRNRDFRAALHKVVLSRCFKPAPVGTTTDSGLD